jgi:GNAT superfamily N-acetyltransferase
MEAARLAQPGDRARILELWQVARDELEPMRGGHLFLRREAVARPRTDERRDHAAWVGTIDEQVVGYATAHTEDLEGGVRHGVVDELFVEEGARSVGVGEALIGEILTWCRRRGCLGVDAAALPGHRATKNFFEESGFTARLLIMHHRFPEGSGSGDREP